MTQNGRTPNAQARALAAEELAWGETHVKAAAAAGIHVKTVSRFLREPAFVQAVAERKAELAGAKREPKPAPPEPVKLPPAVPVDVTLDEARQIRRNCLSVLQPFSIPEPLAKQKQIALPSERLTDGAFRLLREIGNVIRSLESPKEVVVEEPEEKRPARPALRALAGGGWVS